jgi:hypothetical protein
MKPSGRGLAATPYHAANSPGPDSNPEARWAKRKATKLNGLILAEGHSTALPCIVVDSSSTGAQIHLTTGRGGTPATSLPDRFKLQIPFERIELDCRIAWRTEKKLGVKYVSPARALAKVERPRIVAAPKKEKSVIAKIFG